jgi:hypothetical protein
MPSPDGRGLALTVQLAGDGGQNEAGRGGPEVARLRLTNGDDISQDEAIGHLGALAGLARQAADRGHRLYCSATRWHGPGHGRTAAR